MQKPGLSRLTVEIPEELHRRAKVLAAQEGRSIRELVIDALEARLAKARKGGKS